VNGGCVPCYYLLRYLCAHGNDPRLCEAFVRYGETRGTDAIEMAYEAATPELIQAARRHVVDLGLAHYG
jgi:hypothetical protein